MENELTFVAPEGVYSVTEEHKPTLLNPHIVNATPSVYATRLATVVVRYPLHKSGASQGLSQLLGGSKDSKAKDKDKDKEKEKEREKDKEAAKEDGKSLSSSEVHEDDEDVPSSDLNPTSPTQNASPSVLFDTVNTPFTPPMSPVGKKKSVSRPKHNIRTTSSTFVTRLQSAEGITRTLQAKSGEVTFLFYNCAKSFYWTEVGSQAKEPLARITFSAYPACHAVNKFTASPEKLDVVIGFNTGDIVWFDPISSRYVRINKQGCISNSACTSIHWVPSSPALFLVSFADGNIIVFDKERDDDTLFAPSDPVDLTRPPKTQLSSSSSSIPSEESKEKPAATHGEWNPLESIFLSFPRWYPQAGNSQTGKAEKDKTLVLKNPMNHWKVSKRSLIDLAFSPDIRYVAVVSEDGCLRVIDTRLEQLDDCYPSYFGALTTVAWSPDGKLVITGGQDDLVTIFSPFEQRVVARCQGHSSFVSSVAFDDLRCDGRTYRFGSVGEDNKLILWDFSMGALHRPKLQSLHGQRMSNSSTLSLSSRRRSEAADRSTSNLPPAQKEDGLVPRAHYHPAPSRNDVAIVQPVLVKQIEGDMLTSVSFIASGILTVSKAGHVKVWVRPLSVRRERLKTERTKRAFPASDEM